MRRPGEDRSAPGVLAVCRATLAAVCRDFGVFTLLAVAGVLYSFFYPTPYQNEVLRQVPVAVVDLDNSDLSRQLIRLATASPDIAVRQVTADAGEARRALAAGEVFGEIVIPRHFARDIVSGRQVRVPVVGNAAYFLVNKVSLQGLATVAGVVGAGAELKRLQMNGTPGYVAVVARDPIALDTVPLFNTGEGYASYVVPMVAVLIIHQTLLMGVGMLLGSWREGLSAPAWRRGGAALANAAAAPVAVTGMVLAFALIVFVNCLYFFGFVLWWHDYPRTYGWAGNLPDMLVFSVLYALALASLGVLLGQCFTRREHSVLVLLVTSIPFLFLSGAPWPAEALPAWLQWLRWLLPTTPGIQGFVAINQMGGTLVDVRPELAALAAQTALYATLACAVFARARRRERAPA